jgi:hypothetical protein
MFENIVKAGLVFVLMVGNVKAELPTLKWNDLVVAITAKEVCHEKYSAKFKLGDLSNGEGKCYYNESAYIKFPITYKFDGKNKQHIGRYVMSFLSGHGLKADDAGDYCGPMPANMGFSCAIKYTDGTANLLVFNGQDYYAMNFTKSK